MEAACLDRYRGIITAQSLVYSIDLGTRGALSN